MRKKIGANGGKCFFISFGVVLNLSIISSLYLSHFQKYYDAIGQHDLYISYVYKLYDLHMLSNSKVEAAYTLLKHGETLTVSYNSKKFLKNFSRLIFSNMIDQIDFLPFFYQKDLSIINFFFK